MKTYLWQTKHYLDEKAKPNPLILYANYTRFKNHSEGKINEKLQ